MRVTQVLLKIGLAGLAWALGAVAWAQANPKTLNYHLKPTEVAPEVWVFEAPVEDFSKANGCNIINTGAIATAEGTIVINTGVSKHYGEQQRAAIQALNAAPVRQVVNLNLHPDYFFGNQAWADVGVQALAGTMAGQQREGAAYEDNLYRLCGDWMRDSKSTPAQQALTPGTQSLGQHRLIWQRLHGHTSDDLVLIDTHAKVLFAGGLIFKDRVPTAPHADIAAWRESLSQLRGLISAHGLTTIVPSHGPVHHDLSGLTQTLDWLNWMDETFQRSAQAGLDLGEVMRLTVPARFQGWAAMPDEYLRSVTYLYPRYERQALAQ